MSILRMNNAQLSRESLLKDFHVKYGHMVNYSPTTDIPLVVKQLRAALILEEVKETIQAMGFPVKIELGEFDPSMENLVGIADGTADSAYVLIGTDVTYGIPSERIFREVHRSNMTKTPARVEPGQKYGTKTPKGPDYRAPEIEKILEHPDLITTLELESEK